MDAEQTPAEPTVPEQTPTEPVPANRLRLTEQSLIVDDQVFDRAALATHWAPWQPVEDRVRRFKPPVTREELDLLGAIPTANGGHNGYTELCSALFATRTF